MWNQSVFADTDNIYRVRIVRGSPEVEIFQVAYLIPSLSAKTSYARGLGVLLSFMYIHFLHD